MNRQMIIYGAAGAALFVIMLLYFIFAYSPLATGLKDKKQELQEIRKQYAKEQELLSRQDEFSERSSKLRMEKERLNEELPDTDRMPELLKSITMAATECRLRHIKFTPLPRVNKDEYSELRIQLSVTGRYHALGLFISKLSALPRLINAQIVEIKSSEKVDGSDSIQATLMLVTYVRHK